MTLADYIGGLTLAGGDHDGEPFEVLRWEAALPAGRVPPARRLGPEREQRQRQKSALVRRDRLGRGGPRGAPDRPSPRGGLLRCFSFEQSRVIYEDVLAFVGGRYDLSDRLRWRKQDSANRATLEHRPSGARVRCIGSDPGNAHGLRPALVLADEPAQWPPATSARMIAALRTGLGKTPGSRLIALGTRPADELHWFARLLESAPYSQVHAARPEDPPFRLRTWRRANPSLDHLPSLLAQLRTEATDARRDPDALASVQGPAAQPRHRRRGQDSTLLEADRWTEAEALGAPEATGGYVLGIDLGTNAAMSAAAAYWRSGRLEAFAGVPRAARPGRAGPGRRRGQPVPVHGRALGAAGGGPAGQRPRGHAARGPGPLGLAPAAVVADRWREAELRQSLDAAGSALVPGGGARAMGYRDGGEDVRDFRRAVLGGARGPGRVAAAALGAGRGPDHERPRGQLEIGEGLRGRPSDEGPRRRRRRGRAGREQPATGSGTPGAETVGGWWSGPSGEPPPPSPPAERPSLGALRPLDQGPRRLALPVLRTGRAGWRSITSCHCTSGARPGIPRTWQPCAGAATAPRPELSAGPPRRPRWPAGGPSSTNCGSGLPRESPEPPRTAALAAVRPPEVVLMWTLLRGWFERDTATCRGHAPVAPEGGLT